METTLERPRTPARTSRSSGSPVRMTEFGSASAVATTMASIVSRRGRSAANRSAPALRAKISLNGTLVDAMIARTRCTGASIGVPVIDSATTTVGSVTSFFASIAFSMKRRTVSSPRARAVRAPLSRTIRLTSKVHHLAHALLPSWVFRAPSHRATCAIAIGRVSAAANRRSETISLPSARARAKRRMFRCRP